MADLHSVEKAIVLAETETFSLSHWPGLKWGGTIQNRDPAPPVSEH